MMAKAKKPGSAIDNLIARIKAQTMRIEGML
jgi:hypothetical protein